MTAFAFNVVRVNGTTLTGIRSPNYDRREQRMPLAQDGTVHQTADTVIRTAPMASWSTLSVRSLFALLGTGDEVPFVALDGSNGCELHGMRLNTSGPGYSGTSARRRFVSGQLFLDRVTWQPGAPAEASVTAFAISSAGGTEPVTSDTPAAPALPISTEQLALTSAIVTGTSLTRIASVDVAIAHRATNDDQLVSYQLGLPHPILMGQAGVNGASEIIVTVETLDLDTSISATGATSFVFAVLNASGVGLSASTATITINGAFAREETIAGADGAPARRRITIRGIFDGTNRPCTIATA